MVIAVSKSEYHTTYFSIHFLSKKPVHLVVTVYLIRNTSSQDVKDTDSLGCAEQDTY